MEAALSADIDRIAAISCPTNHAVLRDGDRVTVVSATAFDKKFWTVKENPQQGEPSKGSYTALLNGKEVCELPGKFYHFDDEECSGGDAYYGYVRDLAVELRGSTVWVTGTFCKHERIYGECDEYDETPVEGELCQWRPRQ